MISCKCELYLIQVTTLTVMNDVTPDGENKDNRKLMETDF